MSFHPVMPYGTGEWHRSQRKTLPDGPEFQYTPENRARFALIRDLLAEHGYSFRVWTRSEIYAEPRLSNVGLILRYRRVDVPAVEREKIRRTFSSEAGLTLRTVSKTPGMTVPAVLRLVLDGALHIDWWEPLGLDSRISNTPIGLQVWPVPIAWRFQEERCRSTG